MLETWNDLEKSSDKDLDIWEKKELLERAVVNMQLFGNIKQIRLSKKFTDDFTKINSADTTILLKNLQNELRKELGLSESPEPLFFLRISPKTPRTGSPKT
jgi:hypothetical protein